MDLVVIVERSERPFEARALDWDMTDLPVPAEAVIYTVEEWDALPRDGRFHRTLDRETVWVAERR